jgi:hypothetical protein
MLCSTQFGLREREKEIEQRLLLRVPNKSHVSFPRKFENLEKLNNWEPFFPCVTSKFRKLRKNLTATRTTENLDLTTSGRVVMNKNQDLAPDPARSQGLS